MSSATFSATKFIKALDAITDKVTEAVARQLLIDVKNNSPVKSGKFKNSWRLRGKRSKYRITNPQPYGPKLEQGKSKQAPNGVMAPARKNYNPTLRRYER